MPADAELAALHAEAAHVTAAGSRSFYFASRFFPREMAQSAHAVYWFCRYTDDLVDECATPEQGRMDLEAWAHQLALGMAGGTVTHPVLKLFLDTKRRHAIPDEYPLDLIEGMRMDLRCTRYASFDDLRIFCYRVASVVGVMMSYVIGFHGPALDYAVDLGIAMQLTNILRDIDEDLARGRVYLPQDEMLRFGYSEGELRSRTRNGAFRALMRFQVERARQFYVRAEPGIALLDPGGRFAVKIAADVYRGILHRIEASDYNVFGRRAVVPAPQKYWIFLARTLESIRGRT